MSEAKAIEIAESADLILNGYAVTMESSGELSETNMDDVEAEIAVRIVRENRRYICAA